MKRTRLGADPWGIALALAALAPNLLWLSLRGSGDLLSRPSAVPVIDGIAAAAQALLLFCLCFLVRREPTPIRRSLLIGAWACCLGYWAAWGLYAGGAAGAPLLLAMAVLPCTAFLLLALARRNWPVLPPLAVFTVCHLYATIVNFLP